MDKPLYFEEARLWLADHVHDLRRDLLLIVLLLIVMAVTSVVFSVWLIGAVYTAAFLLVIGILYFVLGKLQREPDLIRAETIRPRGPLFVPRMMNVRYFDLHWFQTFFRFVISLLTAPITLCVEAVNLLRKRARLGGIYEEEVSLVLAAITERDGAVDFNELFERIGDGFASDALLQLHDFSCVVWLNAPERVSLTTEAREAIRAA